MSRVTITRDDSLRKKVEADGYIWNEEFQMAEHRVVAFRILGRYLETDEHVHHCNHHKDDNEPRNLFVLSPAIHLIVHLCTLYRLPRSDIPTPHQLMTPETLDEFLTKEGIPHLWLLREKEVRNG